MNIRLQRIYSFIIVLALLCSFISYEPFDRDQTAHAPNHTSHTTIDRAFSLVTEEEACTIEMLAAGSSSAILHLTGRGGLAKYISRKHISRNYALIDTISRPGLHQIHYEHAYINRIKPFHTSELVVLYAHRSDGKKKF